MVLKMASHSNGAPVQEATPLLSAQYDPMQTPYNEAQGSPRSESPGTAILGGPEAEIEAGTALQLPMKPKEQSSVPVMRVAFVLMIGKLYTC